MQRGAGEEISLDSMSETRRDLVALADDRSAIGQIRLLAGQTSFLLAVLLEQRGQL
jgi:hypothetical protein